MIPHPALWLALGLAATPAAAVVWTARDLGTIGTEQACVEAAVRAFETYANLYGADGLRRGGWMVALDGLDRQSNHALITCAHDARLTRATLVIWSETDTVARLMAAERLVQFWNEQRTRLGSAEP